MLSWLLLGVAGWGRAQTACSAVLTGRLVDGGSGAPLAGATVYVRELTTGVVTDETGLFRLTGLCSGRYNLAYQFVGYQTITAPVAVGADSLIVLPSVRLVPDQQTLPEVVVTERRSEADQLLQVRATLSSNALNALRGQSLGESLKTLPGLSTLQTGPSIAKPVIHGLYSNRIITLNNGVRQEDQQWGNEHAPQIDPFGADRLTVIKGAASIRYGSDAIGGVILVEPKALPAAPGLGGELHVVGGTNGRQGVVSGLVEGAVGRRSADAGQFRPTTLSYRLQGTLRRAGYLRTPNYFLENSSHRETAFSATLRYDHRSRPAGAGVDSAGRQTGVEVFYSQFNTQVGLFTGAQVGSLADFYAAIARPEPLRQPRFSSALDRPYQRVQHDLLKVRAFVRSRTGGTLTAVLAHQQNVRREYDRLSFSRVTDPELFLKLTTQTADLIWEHRPVRTATGGGFSGSVGLNSFTQGNVRRFLFLIPNYRNYGAGLFALERFSRGSWTLEGGLRYDYRYLRAFFRDDPTGRVTTRTHHWRNATGSLAATYQLTPRLALSTNLSTAWRAPNVSDLYADGLHQSAVAYERGNPNLRPEQAINANLSVDYTNRRLLVVLQFYTNRINNYIYLRPDSVPLVRQRGAFPAYSYEQVRATFRGIDATIQYKLTDQLSVTSKTSLLMAYDHTNQNYLIGVPPNRIDNSLRYTRTSTRAPATRRVSGLYVSLNGQYVARQHRVPTVTQRQEAGRIIFTGDFAPPPAAYALLGAELGFAWRVGAQPLNVVLTGTNLLNRVYRDYLNRYRYFADEPGRNVILKLNLPFPTGKGRD